MDASYIPIAEARGFTTHWIKSIKVYKETESILNQDENDGDNESKKKE